MKINKDLVDAVMMVSFILLVLIGTSEFSDTTLKIILMGSLGVLSVVMIILRIVEARQNPPIE
ncbi:MAG: hypothetical protein E7085_09820 [Parabacteroides distasonis]|nr:hypothetical protein [Parabacteroides distasonis]MBQ4161856.1 hypothetical protein [Parabacteroides sp.]MBR2497765.1 hypothetical protein [Parabacteroides sp.]